MGLKIINSTMIFNKHNRGILKLVFNENTNEYIVDIKVNWRFSTGKGSFYFRGFKKWNGKLAKTYSVKIYNEINNKEILNPFWYKNKNFIITQYR